MLQKFPAYLKSQSTQNGLPFIVIETPINASFSSAEVTVPEIVRF
jgi:hypothetical protein